MDAQLFGKTFLARQADIRNVLRRLHIFDPDLLHDTYIALYEHSQHAEIGDFVNTFVTFYKNLHRRRSEHECCYMACDNLTMVRLYDRADESDLVYREQVGTRLERLLRYYARHPKPGERNHKRACKILRLYCQGLSIGEISDTLKISQQAVNKSIRRTIEHLKVVAK
ncbi:MAG: hypothetical protein IJT12_04090 [Paludibacteraceae bacterium]|nr:hypothetical protein [Paludibacteraceae bacterium]